MVSVERDDVELPLFSTTVKRLSSRPRQPINHGFEQLGLYSMQHRGITLQKTRSAFTIEVQREPGKGLDFRP